MRGHDSRAYVLLDVISACPPSVVANWVANMGSDADLTGPRGRLGVE
jgi:hypothetical protein